MGKAVICQIHPANLSALKRMHEALLLKSYSPNTIKTYCIEFSQLLYLLKDTSVDSLTPERLRAYFLYCAKQKLSENIIHSSMNAIKFYFEQVLRCDKLFFEETPRPQKKSLLTKVIGKSDIAKLFAQVDNPKHQLMLQLCYGMGLRVSEIYRLTTYLFEGQYGGHYAIRSVQAVFKMAMKKAKINKSVGIHGLRHSYATG